ncbi:unnamed protein product [Haemonchus placei]|uniref:Secreted protein n=1 Tax=Haemonchus placei TaxID=6290 RepID=A0A3P8CDH8_HAEPC|nr:unnamed protein product [Haemonchus placei]
MFLVISISSCSLGLSRSLTATANIVMPSSRAVSAAVAGSSCAYPSVNRTMNFRTFFLAPCFPLANCLIA